MCYCESRKHQNCMRDKEIEYYDPLDMDLCPLCKELEIEQGEMEEQEEDD